MITQPMYLQNALALAALGIPIHFIPGGQKAMKGEACLNWEVNATTDLAEIVRRAEANPEMTNYGLVAVAKLGGYLFLDDDGGIRKAFEAAGGKMQKTLKNKSCSKNFHYVYKHSAKSLAFWEKTGKKAYIKEVNPDGTGELWSLRMDRAYIVGPGSVAENHDGIKAEYKTTHRAEIIKIPDDLLAFLIARWEAAQGNKTTKSSPVTVNTGIVDPAVREREADQMCRGGEILRGAHDDTLTSIGGNLRRIGLDKDEIEIKLIDVCEKRCVNHGTDYREMVKKIATSVSKYPVGKDTTVFVDGKPAGTPASVSVGLSEEKKAEMTAAREKEDAEEKSERDDAISRVREELRARVGPYPTFPIWAIKSTSLWDGFVEPFCRVNSRYEEVLWMSAATIMLNYLALRVRIETSDIIPSIYLVIIGKKGKMIKSASVKDAFRYFQWMGLLEQGSPSLRNAADKVVVFEAGSSEGLGIEAQRIGAKSIILFYDELEQLTLKASIEGSTIKSSLLKMYESADFSNLIKSKKETYSIQAGTYCASLIALTTDKRFKTLWSRLCGDDSGLTERFTFLYQPKDFKPVTIPVSVNTQDGASVTRQRIEAAVNQGIYKFDDLKPLAALLTGDDPWLNREVIRAQKWALYMAVDLGFDTINEEALERAIAVVQYERQVKKHLRPYEAENKFAALQLKIVDLLMQKGGSARLNDLEDTGHAHRQGSTMWGDAVKGLISSRQIDVTGTGKRGDPKIVTLLRIIGSRDED